MRFKDFENKENGPDKAFWGMEYLLTGQEMAAADKYTQETLGISSAILMERAAIGMKEELMEVLHKQDEQAKEIGLRLRHRVAIVCGKGNNGGDGAALARLLDDEGVEARVYALYNVSEGGSLYDELKIWHAYGHKEEIFTQGNLESFHPDVVVDCIFGTGLDRQVEGIPLEAIRAINGYHEEHGALVMSCDIPSGVSCEDGQILGESVQADVTVTFGFYKKGHFLYPGQSKCGRVVKKSMGITRRGLEKVPDMFTYICGQDRPVSLLLPRDPSGNKGTNGKVLILAGSPDMSGAATMCARSAYRSGSGMVKVFTPQENRVIMQDTVPEALLTSYKTGDISGAVKKLHKDMNWAGYLLAGPGLSKSDIARELVRNVLIEAPESMQGLVLDADAIRIIAENDMYDLLRNAGARIPVILTPHMAECAALLRISVEELKINTQLWISKFAQLNHVTILCKDARSMVVTYDDPRVYLNTSGTDALAKAGSGDILAGMVVSLLAQGLPALDAAAAASYIHGIAGQRCASRSSNRSVSAEELTQMIGEIIGH